MDRRKLLRRCRNVAGGACLALCLGCAVSAGLGDSLPGEAVLFQPGGTPVFSIEGRAPAGEEPAPLLTVGSGSVPVHPLELPQAPALSPAPSPDPDRPTALVEEITLDGGAPVAGFFVKDTSGTGLDLAEELSLPPDVSPAGDGRVEILIYHTHTHEAYSTEYTGSYYTDMETRTQDPDRSVVAAGEALKEALEARGYGVIHDATVCDDQFNGSYSRSWEVLQRNLEEYPDIQVTIDVHRDSMTTGDGVKYKPTTVIAGEKTAQCMLLAGSDLYEEWGDFPDWEENLRLILRLQQAATEKYPTLLRPLDFSDCKYNMNATTGSMLVEIGTEVTTVAEARRAAALLGDALADVLDDLKAE